MDKKKNQELNRRKNMAVAEMAKASGAIRRLTHLMSSQYLLLTVSQFMTDEIDELLTDSGMKSNRMISKQKAVERALSDFFDDNSNLIKGDQVNNWAEDTDKFLDIFYKLTGLDEEFVPDNKAVADIIPELGAKYNIKINYNLNYNENE